MGIKEQLAAGVRKGTEAAQRFYGMKSKAEVAQNETYLRELQRRDQLAQEAAIKAKRLPTTLERFGGRIALVTNFKGEGNKGRNIVDKLVELGFNESEYLKIDTIISRKKNWPAVGF